MIKEILREYQSWILA